MQDKQQMDTNEKELTTEESFQILYDTAPKPIQDFLREKRYESVSKQLIHIYNLNTEQSVIISSQLVLMLIGAKSPEEFSSSIKKIDGIGNGIPEKIINDINRLVFVPIQKQIEALKKTQIAKEQETKKEEPEQKQTKYTPDDRQTDNKLINKTNTVYTKMPPPVTQLPNKDTLISKSPIVKEYSVDPYREATN